MGDIAAKKGGRGKAFKEKKGQQKKEHQSEVETKVAHKGYVADGWSKKKIQTNK